MIGAIPEGLSLGHGRYDMHISAWLLLLGGIGLLTVYGAYQIARALFVEAPLPGNVGIAAVAAGGLLLLVIAIRERLAERRNEHFEDE